MLKNHIKAAVRNILKYKSYFFGRIQSHKKGKYVKKLLGRDNYDRELF